jgi:hypothetical protein
MRSCYRPAYPASSTDIRKSPGIYTGHQGDDRQQQYDRLNDKTGSDLHITWILLSGVR